jgi:chaperone modulatory protein CbpM
MMSFDAVISVCQGLRAEELRAWIEQRWVRPESRAEGYVFEDIDIARVKLIYELRHDLAVEEETLPLVLDLLDQVYALRRRMRMMAEVIEKQPIEIRDAILTHFAATDD